MHQVRPFNTARPIEIERAHIGHIAMTAFGVGFFVTHEGPAGINAE